MLAPMAPLAALLGLTSAAAITAAPSTPSALNTKTGVTYKGLVESGIERFLGVPYGQDTGGQNRFAPPRAFVPRRDATINAQKYGPACPQVLGRPFFPISLTNITNISEDCLNLNIARPIGTGKNAKLPVMVWIHGGSFWTGSNEEAVFAPDGLVRESVSNGLPILHVALNYRVGMFGFTKSDALKKVKSENAGLRDQRLGIEWVRDNIAHFGGDPGKITIFGQSSGGLSVGMQIMAYGGKKDVPFQQAIAQSQALEPGITGNFTRNALQLVVDAVKCNKTPLQSPETIACLRALDFQTVLNASISTYVSDIAHNIGDIWLPSVDGDFLPSPPSQLVREGRFADVTAIMGWTDRDVDFFTPTTITTEQDTFNFLKSYLPSMKDATVTEILKQYPSSEFQANAATGLSAQFYRAARLFRDILMVCEPILYGQALARKGNDVYFYNHNQTILDPILTSIGAPPLGPIHTSELAYIFGNFSHYAVDGLPVSPSAADISLQRRESRSWSTFAATGEPSARGKDTLKDWDMAFESKNLANPAVFVVGGPNEGFAAVTGQGVLARQKLGERCAVLNRPDVIAQQDW